MTKDKPDDAATRRDRIRALNDQFRTTGNGNGRVLLTAGIQDGGPVFMVAVTFAVQEFTAFTPDNDPYGEHDFGAVTVAGQKVFWKIDYYDRDYTAASPDPADESVTQRVLTIMLAEEY